MSLRVYLNMDKQMRTVHTGKQTHALFLPHVYTYSESQLAVFLAIGKSFIHITRLTQSELWSA